MTPIAFLTMGFDKPIVERDGRNQVMEVIPVYLSEILRVCLSVLTWLETTFPFQRAPLFQL